MIRRPLQVRLASRRAQRASGSRRIDLFSLPTSLGGEGALLSASASALPGSTLPELLELAGIAAEAASRFAAQDVDLEMATEISLAELQQLVGDRTTLGKVRRLHALLASARQRRRDGEAASRSQLISLKPTATALQHRCMLQMSSAELKEANLMRLTSETVFASLMLTVAVGALVGEQIDKAPCEGRFGQLACDHLEAAYVATFGLASAFFLGSCLVTLGAIISFHNVASAETVHFVSVAAEAYTGLSFLFISTGLLFGLLPGSCVNLFLRFGHSCLGVCIFITAVHWAVWLWQLSCCCIVIRRVYGKVLGFGGFLPFLAGLVGFADLKPAGRGGVGSFAL